MSGPNPARANDDVPIELLQLAEKRFMQWQQERETERLENVRAIQAASLSAAGRATRRLQLLQHQLTEDTRQRCRIYRKVAQENDCLTMLSEAKLGAMKEQIMRGVHYACLTLNQCNANDFFSAGGISPVVEKATQERVDHQLPVSILSVANAELDVLRSEGALWRKTGLPPEAHNPETAKDRLLDGKTEVDLRAAADYLGKSLQHVRRLAHVGSLSVTKSTRPKMVSVQSVRRYLRPGK
jgi:hypothetical protein